MRPFQFKVGETATVSLELIGRDDQDRATYRYKIEDPAGGIDHEGTDLHLGPRSRPDNTLAAKTLLSDLQRSGEATTPAGRYGPRR
jgi:hypothetical protein